MSIDEGKAKQGNASLTIHNVTIADQGTYKCLIIYSPNKVLKEIQLNSQAAPKVTLVKKALSKNRKNHLLCLITNFYPKDITVTWLKNGQVLDGFQLGPFQMDADGIYRVNSSLAIVPMAGQDHLVITCQVKHVSFPEPIQDAYTVQYGEEPEMALFSSHDGDKEVFVCQVRKFYPEAVTMTWLLDGKISEPSRRNPDGTYNKWDHFLIPGYHKKGRNVSCVVEHETLDSPLIRTLTATDTKDTLHVTLAIIATIFGSILLLLISALVYIYKKKYFQLFQLSPIHILSRWNGTINEMIMCCTASNCPEKIHVTWTLEDNGKKMKVPHHLIQSDGELGQLLSGDYPVITDQSETGGFYNAITSLTFTPNASKHQNLKVTCSFRSGSKTKEKHKKWSFEVLRPCLSAPMTLSLDDSGEVVCSVALEKFNPENIQIKWSCGVGIYQELDNAKTETILNSSANTFNCRTKCQVPSHLFQDPGFRVRVTWTHMSLDQPDSREVSVTDLPWRPVMGEIIVPPLVHGTEARMQCEIRGYFPNNLQVKWLRREAGNPELYEVSANENKYKIPIMETVQEPNKTFTCTAILNVSISGITEQGAEFICRVTHPSLERPQEKTTGALTVTGFSVVREIFQHGKNIVLTVDGFSTQDLTVTWGNADERCGPYKRIKEKFVQNYPKNCSDGSFRLTNTCEAVKPVYIFDPSETYFKAIITHRALKIPEEIVFFRTQEDVYMESENGKQIKLIKKATSQNE